jgi:dienelactone hydrolase
MRGWRRIWAGSGLLSCGVACAQQPASSDHVQIVRVPVSSKVANGQGFFLETFLYRPLSKGRHPLVLLSHGSPGGDPKQDEPQAAKAKFFTDRGYIVLVPKRRGRGSSGGNSLESLDKNCNPGSWRTGLRSAYEDVTAAIHYGSALPDVDAKRVLLAGESRGGFLSVAYAAQGSRRSHIVGVVNFVGGWVAQAEDNCPTDFNELAFGVYGRATTIPELWLYGDGDQFYRTPSILSYQQAYATHGGKVTFRLIPGVPDNGHWLPGYPALWSAYVDQYLRSRGLPAAATCTLDKRMSAIGRKPTFKQLRRQMSGLGGKRTLQHVHHVAINGNAVSNLPTNRQ